MNALELTGKVRTHIAQLEEPRVALHREVVAPFLSLRAAAAKEGFDVMPFSAFRDFQAQVVNADVGVLRGYLANAEKVRVTGNKRQAKIYRNHSGYPGGMRERTFAEMQQRNPEEIIRRAVKGMMPRNRLSRAQLTKLKIYAGPDHPHEAQQPKSVEV